MKKKRLVLKRKYCVALTLITCFSLMVFAESDGMAQLISFIIFTLSCFIAAKFTDILEK